MKPKSAGTKEIEFVKNAAGGSYPIWTPERSANQDWHVVQQPCFKMHDGVIYKTHVKVIAPLLSYTVYDLSLDQ